MPPGEDAAVYDRTTDLRAEYLTTMSSETRHELKHMSHSRPHLALGPNTIGHNIILFSYYVRSGHPTRDSMASPGACQEPREPGIHFWTMALCGYRRGQPGRAEGGVKSRCN